MKNYAERGAIKDESGSRRGRRADEEEVRHTHFVYKRNARAGKRRKRAEGGRAEERKSGSGGRGRRAEERKRREAERKRREGAEGSRSEAEGGSRGQQIGSGGRSLYGLSGVQRSLAISFPAMKRQRSELCGRGE